MSANMAFTLRTKIIKPEETFFFLLCICCQCKYGVKIIFDVFAQLGKYDQRSLKIVFATHVKLSFRPANLTI